MCCLCTSWCLVHRNQSWELQGQKRSSAEMLPLTQVSFGIILLCAMFIYHWYKYICFLDCCCRSRILKLYPKNFLQISRAVGEEIPAFKICSCLDADVYVGTLTEAVQDTMVCCQGWKTEKKSVGKDAANGPNCRSCLRCLQVGPFNWYCLLERADWAADWLIHMVKNSTHET